MTHQPEPTVLLRRMWDVVMCAQTMMDPEPGHHFFVENWLDVTVKELKYVQKGLLSDSLRFSLYQIIGYYSTGFRIARCLRQSSDLEAYFQHLSRSVSVHARGAGADYHTMRGDWFDWVWNFKALVRAKKIPDPGTSWLWLVDMASQAFSDLPAASAHAFFRAWQSTNTGVEPTLNRGIYPEAVATVLRNGSTVSELISPADQRRVLQFPELVASGDVLGIERVTGLVVRRARLQELQVTIEEEARVATALHGRNAAELRQRLYVGDGGVALPAAPQEPMRLLVSPPPVFALPLALGSVPGAHPSVVFAAAPLPAEREWGSADGGAASSADGGAASSEEQRECRYKKYRRTRNATETEAQRTARRDAERRKKQQQRAAAAARNGNGPVASPLNATAEILIGLSMGAIGTTSPIADSHTGSSMEQEQAGD